ncbi:MAG: flagellar basal body P-ring formation chaperone FlgA [Desulfobacterota bacterium]|jgi:flagella basal body P-ring formation protein FlgA|nr:flagellar basal body P-ring formation chaperone FlgA [Thermodesulfobacteriota bacterium]
MASGENIVDIKTEAAITGRTLRLSDVAEVSGPDASTLAQIVLAESPGGLSGLIMTGKVIKETVRLRYRGPVVFTGAGSVHAVPCTVEVPEETLAKVFVEEIHRKSPWKDAGKMEVYDIRVSRIPRVLSADSRTIRAKYSSRDDFLGFTTATLSVGAGSSPEKVTVTGRVRVMAEIPLVRTKVPSGRVVQAGDLVIRPFDISECPTAYMNLEDCVGKRAKVTLREGNPIQSSQVERMPDVCSGEIVMIQARLKNIMVEVQGIAVRDGYKGEHIPVRNPSSGRQVIGTIIAPSVVQVEL